MSKRGSMEIDRISNLPGNIIDHILMRLPIKDAAKTSVLSRNWIYKWTELSYITITGYDLYSESSEEKDLSVVDHILLVHLGPILKFKLEISVYDVANYKAALDRWIIHLSRNHTKEFELNLNIYRRKIMNYQVPYCFFSWQSLTNLVCRYIRLRLPSTFTGFINMKSLELQYVNIEKDDCENLISRCPVLERLKLDRNYYTFGHVKINAPNLQFLYLDIDCEGISFENTSCLAEVFIHYCGEQDLILEQDSSIFSNFFSSLLMVRRLDICYSFLEYLASGVDPGKLSISCNCLEDLVVSVDGSCPGHWLSTLCLLKMSPNLTKLSIEAFDSDDSSELEDSDPFMYEKTYFWEDDHCNCMLAGLQYVEITGWLSSSGRHVLGFIKFILSNSPVLEKMVIKSKLDHCFLRDLLSLRRSSVLAQIICLLD